MTFVASNVSSEHQHQHSLTHDKSLWSKSYLLFILAVRHCSWWKFTHSNFKMSQPWNPCTPCLGPHVIPEIFQDVLKLPSCSLSKAWWWGYKRKSSRGGERSGFAWHPEGLETSLLCSFASLIVQKLAEATYHLLFPSSTSWISVAANAANN